MHEVARGTDVEAMVNSDVSLYGIEWSNDGTHLTLDLDLPNRGRHTLEFTWAAPIRISIDSNPQQGGPPLSWETSYERLTSGRTRVGFNFSDRGSIEVECNDLVLRKSENREQDVDPNA